MQQTGPASGLRHIAWDSLGDLLTAAAGQYIRSGHGDRKAVQLRDIGCFLRVRCWMSGAVTLGWAHPARHPTVRSCKGALDLLSTHVHSSGLCGQNGRREVRKPDPDNSSNC